MAANQVGRDMKHTRVLVILGEFGHWIFPVLTLIPLGAAFALGLPGSSVQMLRGATVCTWTGTTSESEIQRRPDIYSKSMNAAQDCINALQSGQVTGVSTDRLILYGFAHHDPSHTLEVVPNVTIGSPNYYGVGINKAHRPDCKKLADDLQKYVASSNWQADVLLAFPDLADSDKWTNLRPRPEYVSSWSCREKLPN